MTNHSLKQQLIQQLNETVRTLHQLEGAIQILNKLEEESAASELEEETIPVIED